MQLQDITELKKFWNFSETPILHRNVANFIYFGKLADQDVVLRLTPVSQRTASEVGAELEWMNQLGKNGFPVPQLILSSVGRLFETLSVNEQTFHVMVMIKIDGVRIEENSLDEKVILMWSDLLAKLHKNAPLENSGLARATWDKDYIMKSSLPEVPRCENHVQKLFYDLVQFVKAQPKELYGLIHGDVHTGNFFLKNDKIVIFDFDDSCYHYFLYDLTVPIIAIFKIFEKPDDEVKRNRLINLLIENYFKSIPRPKNFKADFIKFIQFRCILVYLWLKVIRNERELSEKMAQSFDQAIQHDLHLATHPEIFDFIAQ